MKSRGKVLRRGYTTGTCAAAAAKAAVSLLFGGATKEAEVALPIGEKIVLRILDTEFSGDLARCCVVKDAGDDPDVTDGAKICAMARKTGKGITLKGGEGVGVVTKPGLQVEVGDPAINPTPKEMILDEVKKVLPEEAGVEVTIYVPGGEELAKRTMNEKLGIVGGISIIGTTGIVEPKSEEAFKASLVPQIDIALAMEYDEIVLTPGRIGERSALAKGIPGDAIVQMGNFVGFMLKESARKGVKRALLFGHLGKLSKVAAGYFNTHSRVVEARLETIAGHLSAMGADDEVIDSVLSANTSENALEILREKGLIRVFDSIAKEAGIRAMRYVDGRMEIGVALISLRGELIGKYNLEVCRWGRYLS